MEKSYVGIELKICPVTAKPHEVGVLIDRKLKDKLDRSNITGWEFSPEIIEKFDDGFIALVGIDPEKSEKPFKAETVHRTGEIAFIKKHIFDKIFNADVVKLAFCNTDVIHYLQNLKKI